MRNKNKLTKLHGDWLSRINLDISLSELVIKIANIYDLGQIASWQPIEEGLDDCNIKLHTNRGKYVVKIFSKDKTEEVITDNVNALRHFRQSLIPVPQLISSGDRYLFKENGKKHTLYVCVTEFFEGESLAAIPVNDDDVRTVTRYLARIHQIPLTVHRNYDSWGTANLLNEYHLKKRFLKQEDLQLVVPVINDFGKINMDELKKCVIHGDLQKTHVLKNGNEYCVLDLGCMDYNARVIDLAIFLALFCFDTSSSQRNQSLFNVVLEAYQKISPVSPLTESEIDVLPLLVRATYASYLLASSSSIAKGDSTAQVRRWNDFSRSCLIFVVDNPIRYHT